MDDQGYTIEEDDVNLNEQRKEEPQSDEVYNTFTNISLSGSGFEDIFKFFSRDSLLDPLISKVSNVKSKNYKFKKATFKDYKIDQFVQESKNGFTIYIILKNLMTDSKSLELKDLKVTKKSENTIQTSFLWGQTALQGTINIPSTYKNFKLNNYYFKDNYILVLDYVFI